MRLWFLGGVLIGLPPRMRDGRHSELCLQTIVCEVFLSPSRDVQSRVRTCSLNATLSEGLQLFQSCPLSSESSADYFDIVKSEWWNIQSHHNFQLRNFILKPFHYFSMFFCGLLYFLGIQPLPDLLIILIIILTRSPSCLFVPLTFITLCWPLSHILRIVSQPSRSKLPYFFQPMLKYFLTFISKHIRRWNYAPL